MQKLYVRTPSLMCFYVDAETLEPLSCGVYDAYTDPMPVPTIEYSEWLNRRRPH